MDGNYQDITATWVSAWDGKYTDADRVAGLIPDGFEVGDLKPHLVEYIPEGDYILREETTPYGFLQSVDVPFTITDTQVIQKAEMIDEIPDGILKITKSDTDRPDERLQGAQFQLENMTTGTLCETVTTDEQGMHNSSHSRLVIWTEMETLSHTPISAARQKQPQAICSL